MKSILVTGGAGFIGSHLVDRLLADGNSVVVLDNFNNAYNPDIKRSNIYNHHKYSTYTLYEGDIRNIKDVNDIFLQTKFDQVIHLAAMAGVRPSIENPSLYTDVNVNGTLNILEACRIHGVHDFIFASSSSVYGNTSVFTEDINIDTPISPYAATKKAGELLAYTYHHLFGIKTMCLRFFTVYGPRQRPDMAIHLFMDKIFHDQKISMYGNGNTYRDYTYIDDIIECIIKLSVINYNYEILNLGRSDTVQLTSLICKIEECLMKKANIAHYDIQPGDVEYTCAHVEKIKSLINFSPTISIDEGLKRFTNWFVTKELQQ